MGFFQKMEAADFFVLLDDVQYSKGNWHNRNRFLNTNGVEEWFTVQVEKGANKKAIKDVKVVDNGPWRKKVIQKLYQNFGYDFTDVYSGNRLIDINMNSIRWSKNKLGMFNPMWFSSHIPNIVTTGTQRLVDICRYFKATEYLCGEGALAYIDESLFTDIKLTIFKPEVENNYSVVQNV